MKLYELQEQLVNIDNILEANTDEETREILETARYEVLQAIDGKVENILDFIADCKARIQQLKEEEERLASKRKSLENKTEYLKNMLMWYMKSQDMTKGSFGTWDITIAKTAGKVVFDIDEEQIPDKYKKISYSVDKTAIKEQMTDGEFVLDGVKVAHLESGESLRIK